MNDQNKLTRKEYLKKVVTNMIAHTTNPILRIIELVLLGKYASKFSIAGLGIVMTILNTMDWILVFFRISIINSSAKLYRQGKKSEQAKVLWEHVTLVLIIGNGLILFREPIWHFFMWLYQPEGAILSEAYTYFHIAIWGMPVTLVNYMISGWLLGREQGRHAALLEIGLNIVSVVGCVLLVSVYDMGIAGMAEMFIISQVIVFLIGILILLKKERFVFKYLNEISICTPTEVWNNISREKNIILRTVCVVVVTNVVMATSCHIGNMVLIINTIMMQMKDVMAYLFEGIATTIREIATKGIKDEDIDFWTELHKMTLTNVMYAMIGLVVFYRITSIGLISVMTNEIDVKKFFLTYDGWLVVYPIFAGWGVSGYSLYAGHIDDRLVRNIYIIAIATFILTYIWALPMLGNHGLWLAFISFYLVRSIGLLFYDGHLYT